MGTLAIYEYFGYVDWQMISVVAVAAAAASSSSFSSSSGSA